MEYGRAQVDAYSGFLAELQAGARGYVERGLRRLLASSPAPTVAELRDAAADLLRRASYIYGDSASKAACDLYDEVMAELGIDVDPAELFNEGDAEGDDRKARYEVGKAAEGDADGFVDAMASAAADHVLRAANRTVTHNADRERDRRAGVRYARVPTGRTTCGFCVTLASLGFYYASKESAGDIGARFNDFHRRCDCKVLPGVEGSTVDGYDPDWYLKVYDDARATVEEDARRRWAAMADDERKAKGTFDEFLDGRAFAEISTRSRQWVYGRKPGNITKDEKAEPKPKERRAAEWLAGHGFDVHFRATRSAEGKKTSDVFLGGPDGVAWEMKQPRGSGKWNISNQFNEAKGQSGRLILDVSESPWPIEDIEAEVVKQLRYREDFSEVLIVKDGYMKRHKK